MQFGFSYVGLIFLLMLLIPNMMWARRRPRGYDAIVTQENRVLLLLERIGEAAVTTSALIFSDFNLRSLDAGCCFLVAAVAAMLLYEGFWVRYFRSDRELSDFYCSFCKIPLAGATLPCIAFLLLALYGKNLVLLFSVLILSVGHIGIHAQHKAAMHS